MKKRPINIIIPGKLGNNYTVYGGINKEGHYVYTISFSTNKVGFIEFLNHMRVGIPKIKSITIVLDNHSAH